MKIAGKQLTSIVFTMAITIFTVGILSADTHQPTVCENGKEEKGHDTFTEGPHVFYKKGKICVKHVHFTSGNTKLVEKSYPSKTDIPYLTCTVDNEQKTSFRIKLHSEYKSPPTVYKQPEKLFAISDIEGNFEAFEKTLIGNGLINQKLDWIYGKGHLVLVGDFFDRGYNVTPVLWLIYKLEQEAKKAGGMVHFINGNHEEMNMRGDVRYVKKRYIKTAKAIKTTYANLYSVDTELGRWLRSKNVIEKIGKTIFVHGGLSPQMAESHIRLEDMNKYARSNYGTDKWRLEQKGGTAAAVFSKYGPMWYRGYFRGKLPQKIIDQTLNMYSAKHVVVGHTIVPKVSSLHQGRVIAIDVKHDIALSEEHASSLLFQNNKIYAVNVNGKRSPIEVFMTEDIVVGAFKGIKEGDKGVVKGFLDDSSDDRINKYYFSKRITMLQAAILSNQVEMVDFLIKEGANIDMLSNNKTPLMHAIEINNQSIVNVLIKNGANINAINKQKKSPLFYCAKHGHIEIAKYLVERGARIDLKDGKGRTAAEYALKNDQKKVATYLQTCKH